MIRYKYLHWIRRTIWHQTSERINLQRQIKKVIRTLCIRWTNSEDQGIRIIKRWSNVWRKIKFGWSWYVNIKNKFFKIKKYSFKRYFQAKTISKNNSLPYQEQQFPIYFNYQVCLILWYIIFFVLKYIKIIYFFYFIFNINLLKSLKKIKKT